jgi:hypothetical protein
MFWKRKKTTKPIEIADSRPTLEITLPSGEVVQWRYEIILLKMEIDRLGEPTADNLAVFRDFLIEQGMPACNLDVAMRIWSVAIVQFQQLAIDIRSQVEALVKDA